MSVKYLIIGAKGQLGGEFCRFYGDQALGIDLPELDISSWLSVEDAFESIKPEAVINTAAYTKVDAAEQQPAICRKVNAYGPKYLAQACEKRNIPIVQFSSDYVFCGTGKREPLTELDPVFPEGVYAKTKYEGEENVRAWRKHLILRTCGLYGQLGENTPGNFVQTMIRLGKAGRPLKIVNDQHCTPTYIPDLVRAAAFLLGRELWGTYHTTNSGATTWFDFAREIFRLEDLKFEAEGITTEQWGAPSPRPLYSVLNISKYLATGAPEMPAWQDALKRYLGRRV